MPLFASNAITWLFGDVTNITPSFTTAADSCGRPSPVENDQTSLRWVTLRGVMSRSGLNPQPLYVRRVISQFASSGRSNRSAVTVWYATVAGATTSRDEGGACCPDAASRVSAAATVAAARSERA